MKQFKLKLILLLSASSLLVTSVLSISFNNKNHQTSNSIVWTKFNQSCWFIDSTFFKSVLNFFKKLFAFSIPEL